VVLVIYVKEQKIPGESKTANQVKPAETPQYINNYYNITINNLRRNNMEPRVTIVSKYDSTSRNFWYGSGIYVVKNYDKSNTSEFDPSTGTSKRQGCYDKMLYELPEIDLKDVDTTYRGKPGRCMCGCSGKYFSPDEGSSLVTKRIIKKVRDHQSQGIDVIKDYIFTIVVGETQYSIYLKNK
jgi:hypothetical protein